MAGCFSKRRLADAGGTVGRNAVLRRRSADRSEGSCSRRASHNDTQTQLPAQDFAEKRHPNAVVRSTAQIIFVRLPFGTPDERQNPQARHLFPLGAHTFNGIRCPTSTRKRQGRLFSAKNARSAAKTTAQTYRPQIRKREERECPPRPRRAFLRGKRRSAERTIAKGFGIS